ncbi:MAG: hypothetical protein DDT18_00045 [Actinobacteria bacterium]|nr:hypothetical protein [Actinomycetota bacterium]
MGGRTRRFKRGVGLVAQEQLNIPVSLAVKDTAFRPAARSFTLAKTFLWFVAFTLAISGFVRIEPAPYDFLVAGLLLMGLVANLLRFSRKLLVPLLLVCGYLASNMVPMMTMQEDVEGATHVTLIRTYLVMSCLLFVGVLWAYGRRGFQLIWLGYLVAAITSSLLGTLGALGLPLFREYFVLLEFRASGFFKDPNVFAPFLIPASLYALYRWHVATSRYERLLWAAAFVVLLAGVLLAMSRAAWLNIGVALAIFLLIPGLIGFKSRVRTIALLGSLALFLVVFMISNPTLIDRIDARLGFQAYDQDRFGTQIAALHMALDNPLGVGPGQAEEALEMATHSLYLRLLVENGWLGFVAFMLLIILSLRRSLLNSLRGTLWSRWMYTLVTASLCGVLANSLFIDSLHWRHFYVLLALAWGPYEATVSRHQR